MQLKQFLTNRGTQIFVLGVDNQGRNWYSCFLTAGSNWYTWSCHLGPQLMQFLNRLSQLVLPPVRCNNGAAAILRQVTGCLTFVAWSSSIVWTLTWDILYVSLILTIINYVLPTIQLCVLRGSQNKQRLFLFTALTYCFYNRGSVYCAVRTGSWEQTDTVIFSLKGTKGETVCVWFNL